MPTTGLLGTVLVILITLGYLNPWWNVLAVICVMHAIGQEMSFGKKPDAGQM